MASSRRYKTPASGFIMPQTKPRKYNNQRAFGIAPDGSQRTYDSIREAVYSTGLFARARAGEIALWEPQVRITLEIEGKPFVPYLGKQPSVYIADFVVQMHNGDTEIHEVKGYQDDKDPVTRLWKHKLGIVQIMHPTWKVVMA
jgi:hypothetical protein